MSSNKKSIYQKLSAASQLPRDLCDGAVLVSVTGQEEVYVENYKGILEYTNTRLCLQAKHCKLEIQGECLCITYYTGEELKITGHIEQINYL